MAKTKILPNPILSERIKLARVSHEPKITQAALAEMIGVTDQTIRKYESGNYGVPKMAVKQIAKALGCCVEFLQGETLYFSAEEYETDVLKLKRNREEGKEEVAKLADRCHVIGSFFQKNLGCTIMEACREENDGSVIPVTKIKTDDGLEYDFESIHEIEAFLSNFFSDTNKLLRYHLLDYLRKVKRGD